MNIMSTLSCEEMSDILKNVKCDHKNLDNNLRL